MKKNKLFKIITKSVALYTILCIFSLITAVVLCFYCAKSSNVWLCFFKDIAVIIATTFAVSLLIGVLLEKNTKEDFYVELTKDTINSKTFSDRLTENEKNLLCKSINKKFRCNNNNALYNVYSNLEKRFVEQNFMDKRYYIEECRYDIVCRVKDCFIEKEYVKTMYFKSYACKHTLNELELGVHSNRFWGTEPSFELISLSVETGKDLSEKELKKYVEIAPNDTREALDIGHNYNNKRVCKYKKKLVLDETNPTVISYRYITRTDLSDDILTVRCSTPCKKFSVNFSIENNDYTVSAVAFGFIDSAKSSPVPPSKKNISVEFRDWILPEDGVVLLVKKT